MMVLAFVLHCHHLWPRFLPSAGKLVVEPDPGLYHFINQGCLTVDNMDDKEEMQIADVCIEITLHDYT